MVVISGRALQKAKAVLMKAKAVLMKEIYLFLYLHYVPLTKGREETLFMLNT
jgi:hypothetical protein